VETRASYLLVGAFVLVLLAGFGGFVVWLVGGLRDDRVALYDIVFTSSISGLQEGGQIQYRGVPVGRVRAIGIDPNDIGRVIVTAEIEDRTPIREDTVATLELRGVTGIAHLQLSEGTGPSAPLVARPGEPRPAIPGMPSALDQVFESTPELLARGVEVLNRLTEVLDEANLQALGTTLTNVEAITATLAAQTDGVGGLMERTTGAAGNVEVAAVELARLAEDLRVLVNTLGGQTEALTGEAAETLQQVQGSVARLGDAAVQLDTVVGELREPLNDFAATGLYNFSQLIGETRLLVAALSRITTEFERNPAGFLLGTNQRGFEP
jgi:phospholipid/cholesterol/gamma-HCH transport system substrate-binding protein